jgi:hypothetical protein
VIRRAGLVCVLALATCLAAAAPAAGGVWLAGDLHVHTTYSHDSYGGPTDDNTGPDEAYTLGHTVLDQFAIAKSRGLDYLAITDHNDIRSQTDPGFGFGGLVAIPAYENSLHGHAQMLGATKLYDNGDQSIEAIRELERRLHRDSGVFQANHPSDPVWEYAYDVPVDSVEVWNLPWYYQPPFPSASDNDHALAYWEGWLDRGAHVAATGGSDNHWLSTTALQGVGQPTTWVYANDRSVRGVLEGIRAGHTFVSWQPPGYGGPRVYLEGDANRNGSYESMVGDTVRPGTSLRVRVKDAPGDTLRVVTNGGHQVGDAVQVTSADFELELKAPPGTWVRAEVYGDDAREGRRSVCNTVFGADVTAPTTYCTNRVVMQALSSALYLRGHRSRRAR